MDDGFSQERIRLIRELAAKADSFTKRGLLDLVRRYDDLNHRPLNDVPHALANLPSVALIACKGKPPRGSSSGISQARSG
jgi:hypothetical protein